MITSQFLNILCLGEYFDEDIWSSGVSREIICPSIGCQSGPDKLIERRLRLSPEREREDEDWAETVRNVIVTCLAPLHFCVAKCSLGGKNEAGKKISQDIFLFRGASVYGDWCQD